MDWAEALQAAGMTAGDYVRRRKDTLALDALKRGETLAVLAERFGYESPESFSKAFRRCQGVSPREFRRSGAPGTRFERLRFVREAGKIPRAVCHQERMRPMKREGYLTWDEYFMGVALLSAQRSKDPGTQVGACIVSADNKILSVGYNGMPTGCADDEMPWEREGDPLETKYLFVCHAELNAILNHGGTDLRGARVYSTLFPCNECAKAIIQAGIREVIYRSDKYADTDAVVASKKMFELAGVAVRAYEPGGKTVELTV